MPDRIAVSAADFVRNVGHWQSEALEHPVSITHHGRERLVLISSKRYKALAAKSEEAAPDVSTQAALDQHAWLLEHIQEGYLLLNRGLSVVRANSVAHGLLGLTAEQLHDDDFLQHLSATGAASLRECLKAVLRTGLPTELDCDPIAFEGRHLKIFAAPAALGLAVTIASQTERAQARRRQDEHDALRATIEKLPCLSELDLNHFGRVDAVDMQFVRVSGFSEHDLKGRRFADIIPAARRRDFVFAFESVFASGAAISVSTEIVCRTTDVKPAQVGIARVKGEGAKLLIHWSEPCG